MSENIIYCTNKKKLNNLKSVITFDLKTRFLDSMRRFIFIMFSFLGLHFACCIGWRVIYSKWTVCYICHTTHLGFISTVISAKRRRKMKKERWDQRSTRCTKKNKKTAFLPRVSFVVWTTFRRRDQRVGIVSHRGEADSCHSSPLWCLSALAESFSSSCGSQCYNDDQRWQMYS